jgi:hypothetical protein
MKRFFITAIFISLCASVLYGEESWGVRCDAERVWRELGREITEENLIKALNLDWETQVEQQKEWFSEFQKEYKAGRVSEEEYRTRLDDRIPIMERNSALEIIEAYGYQSPEIDRIVMQIYEDNMGDMLVRYRCLRVILNNVPDQGIRFLKEFVEDQERVELDYRLLGASLLLDRGCHIAPELIAEGLESTSFTTHRSAENLQRKTDKISASDYLPPPPVKTIPPRGSSDAVSDSDNIDKEETTVSDTQHFLESDNRSLTQGNSSSSPEDISTEKKPTSKVWKLLFPILGIAAVSSLFFLRRKRA